MKTPEQLKGTMDKTEFQIVLQGAIAGNHNDCDGTL